MHVVYCDFCDAPIKDGTGNVLIKLPRNKDEQSTEISMLQLRELLLNSSKEICDECDEIIEAIFKLRKKNLNKLKKELLGIYNSPTKEPHKAKRKRKAKGDDSEKHNNHN